MLSKICHILLLFAFILFILPSRVFAADILINEFSSATSDDDWVELYNTSSSQSQDLSNYTLIDGSTSGNPVTFNCILAPQGFVIASWSNRLNNGGDIIRLKNVDTFIDCVAYGDGAGQKCDGKSVVDIVSIESGEYGARSVDGTGSWIKTTTVTKDGPNNGSSKNAGAVCSTPTLTLTPSPTPTLSPTPKPTSTPTPTPTPTTKPSNTPTKTPTPTSKPSIILTPSKIPTKILPDSVLGEATKSALPTKEEEKSDVKVESLSLKPDNLIAKIFIFLGVVFLLACAIVIAYPFIVRFKREKLSE